jgi:ATP-dependent Clp protease ATP-binding subunit ClpA
MFQRFTREARAVVVSAQREADALGAPAIGPEHLLLGVAQARPDDPAARVLADAGLDAPAVHAALEDELAAALAPLGIPAAAVEAIGPSAPTGRRLRFAPAAKTAMEQALRSAVERGDKRIEARHMALGVLRVPSGAVQRLLDQAGTDRAELSRALGAGT